MIWLRNGELINENLNDYLEKTFNQIINNGMDFKIAIGTDSQKKSGKYNFVTVILIILKENSIGNRQIGKGGQIIYTKSVDFNIKKSLNERMLLEVTKSIDVANQIAYLIEKYQKKIEIHVDINKNSKWASNVVLNQAIGYISGMGYDFKVKPDSIASTNCADKLC